MAGVTEKHRNKSTKRLRKEEGIRLGQKNRKTEKKRDKEIEKQI
jgi:hypothetical protein